MTWLSLVGLAMQSWLPSAVATESTTICITGHAQPLTVEIAETEQQRARGLMLRSELAEHAGMWFKYREQRPGYNGFWMYQTLLPLDIAYLDQDQVIVKIMQMQPCGSQDPTACPSYRPGVSFYGALEMNINYFSTHGITEGDQLIACERTS